MKRYHIFVMILFGVIGGQLSYLYHQDALSIKSNMAGAESQILSGVLLGIMVYVLVYFLSEKWGDLVLDEVKVSTGLGDFKFVVNTEYRRVAWHLFIETTTRIATQPLGSEEGFLREALNSLYALFTFTRQVLKDLNPRFFNEKLSAGETTVEMFAFDMLNNELRPFLSKWHPMLSLYEKKNPDAPESDWGEAEKFREELEALRQNILKYAEGFGQIAKVPDYQKYLRAEPTAPAAE